MMPNVFNREIALHAGPHIDIIVGGHSHTLLFNGEVPQNSSFTPYGPYPVVVEQASRKVSFFNIFQKNVRNTGLITTDDDLLQVLIVQAAAHTQYLGEIKLTFDEAGKLLRWNGNPHYIGNDIPQGTSLSQGLLK